MEIEMIKISIKNVKHHTNVALLVDKPKFLKHIAYLREKWKIKKPFKVSEYQKFYAHIWGENTDEERWDNFLKDIEKARRLFNRTPNFDKVIIYATGFNEIPEHAYKSCYLRTIQNSKDPDDIEYAIIVTPYTTKTELDAEFIEFKKMIKAGLEQETDKTKLNSAVESYEYEPGPKFPDFDERTKIERARTWYWMRFKDYLEGKIKKPKSYPQILEEWQSKCIYYNAPSDKTPDNHNCRYCELSDQNIIERAVSEYVKAIKQS